MVAVPDLKASVGLGESIFIVGKLVTWKRRLGQKMNPTFSEFCLLTWSPSLYQSRALPATSARSSIQPMRKEMILSKGHLHNFLFFLSLFFFVFLLGI